MSEPLRTAIWNALSGYNLHTPQKDQIVDDVLVEIFADHRAKVIEQLRWLARARAEYDHIPEGGYHSATESERLVHHEHRAVEGVADILEGSNDGMGWLPSWKWDEWAAISSPTAANAGAAQ